MWAGLVIWVTFEVAFLRFGVRSGDDRLIMLLYALRGFGYPLFAFGFLVWITASVPAGRLGTAVGWFWFAFTGGLPTLGSLLASVTVPRIGEYVKPQEWTLVADFYREWKGTEEARPTVKELGQAREMLREHGPQKARSLLQLAIRRMRAEWPEAKSFAAVGKFLGDASQAHDRERQRAERDRLEQARKSADRAEQARRQVAWEGFESEWRPRFLALPEPEREQLRRAVVGPRAYLANTPRIVEGMCLEELARRSGVEVPAC